ncbi:MAG: hypothetical protein KDD22_05055, partial [Bdellovibrionales bacterium]|nr:hypothetical protein [Bdellovibrionales bacterium]
MRIDKNALIILFVAMGLIVSWLSSYKPKTSINAGIGNLSLQYDTSSEPFARTEQETSLTDRMKSSYTKFKGKVQQTAENIFEHLPGQISFGHTEPKEEELSAEEQAGEEVESDEPEIIGYDTEGNPIFAAEKKADGDEKAENKKDTEKDDNDEPEIIGYDKDGNPVYAAKKKSDETGDEEDSEDEENIVGYDKDGNPIYASKEDAERNKKKE